MPRSSRGQRQIDQPHASAKLSKVATTKYASTLGCKAALRSACKIPRNNNAGMVTLNTSADAVWIKLSLIQPTRLSTTPKKSMANTGAVIVSV